MVSLILPGVKMLHKMTFNQLVELFEHAMHKSEVEIKYKTLHLFVAKLAQNRLLKSHCYRIKW